MTNRELKKLKASQPPKYRDMLAAKFDVTTTYIDMILRGAYIRHDIIDSAIELAVEHKRMLDEQKAKIKLL